MIAPQFDMTAPQPRQPEERFLNTIAGVFFDPVPTLIGVIRRRPIANAGIVIIVVSIAQGLVQALSVDSLPLLSSWREAIEDDDELLRLFQGSIVLASPIGGIVGMSIATGVLWLMSRILGGNGEYGAMFAGLGFALAPFILLSLIGLLAIPLGSGGETMIGLVQLGVITWTIILGVIVVRESNQFSTERAGAAVLIPIIAFIVFVIAAVVLLVVVLAVETAAAVGY